MADEKDEDWFVKNPEPFPRPSLRDFPVMVNLVGKKKRGGSSRLFVTIGVLAAIALGMIGFLFAVNVAPKKSQPTFPPAKTKSVSVATPIAAAKPVDMSVPQSDIGETMMSNVSMKVQPRAEDGKLNVEVTLPGEQRLFYVCEPRR